MLEFGDHSYDHPHMSRLDAPRIAAEIDRTETALGRYSKHSVAFRPPFGDWNPLVMQVARGSGNFQASSSPPDRYPDRRMSTVTFSSWFAAQQPQIPLAGAQAILALAEGGATVPFIARYRKEQTGNLDEVAIRQVLDAKERWDAIIKRQTFIVEEIGRQGKLTPELKARIRATFDETVLEDLYLPYKLKRKTKAKTAREAGLEPLADWLWGVAHGEVDPAEETPAARAAGFVDADKGVADVAAALAGASDIVVERLSEDAALRQRVRSALFERGYMRTRKGEKAKTPSRFENYFAYQEPVRELLKPAASHRYLAMRRGWMEEELVLSLGGALAEDGVTDPLERRAGRAVRGGRLPGRGAATFAGAPLLKRAARLALRGYVAPAIETEVHKALREVADTAAIEVFAENVRKLLLAAPFGPKPVLGVDPGLRTGCKLAVVDASGRYVGSSLMHLETPAGKAAAAPILADLVKKGGIRAVAVGNGTAGRETETFVREALRHFEIDVPVVMVSEAGASVYSASDAAREEFPELDVTVRGAISIARRLQDPLAELVKIDPKSIGVGQYQHDVSQTGLKKSLDEVVDSCVNQVGVNVNTASYHLLGRVSGIGPGLARAIVEHRGEGGAVQVARRAAGGPALRQEDVRAGGGLSARPGLGRAARQHRRSPGALRGARARRDGARACRPRTCWGPA